MDFDNNSMLGEFKWHREKGEAFSLDLVANMHMPNLLAELKKEKTKKPNSVRTKALGGKESHGLEEAVKASWVGFS